MPKQSGTQKKIVTKVMHAFKHGDLKSGTGKKVKNPRQAIAIGLHEAGASRKENTKKNKENLEHTKRREKKNSAASAKKK